MPLLLVIPWLAAGGPPPSALTAFVNVAVIPMDQERVLTGQTVVVRDGHISAMGPTDQVQVPAGAVQVDGRGKFLIPGLGDMHVHVGPQKEVAEYRMLKYVGQGVTTVRVMYGTPEMLQFRERAARGEVLSPRVYVGTELITRIPTPDSAKAIVTHAKAAGYDFLKLYTIDAGGITPEAFDTFAAVAKREGIPFAGHTPLPPLGLAAMLRGHAASIEHLGGYIYASFNLLGGHITLDSLDNGESAIREADMPAAAAATRRAGVWNCPTIALVLRLANDDDAVLVESFLKMVKALSDSGAGLLAGTDLPSLALSWELTALVDAGLTPYQALAAGTRNVAQFFGTLDSTGTVAVGKQADLVLLNGNPLANIGSVENPVGVMLHGAWFPRDVLEMRIAAAKKAAGVTDEEADTNAATP